MSYIAPSDDASGVERESEILAVFSSDLDPVTIEPAAFALTSGGAMIPGSLEVDEAFVRFSPETTLPPMAEFQLSLSASISGANGASLGTAQAISFATRDVEWQPPVNIENILGSSDSARIGVDDAGDAIVVFRQTEGASSNIRATEYDRETGIWSPSYLLETDTGTADTPVLAVDPSGDAVAVWRQNDGMRMSLYGARYVKGVGWGARSQLESDNNGDVTIIDAAVGPTGVVFLVWTQFDGTRYDVWANRFLPGAGWGLEQKIEAVVDSATGAPKVAASADGTAIAVSPCVRVVVALSAKRGGSSERTSGARKAALRDSI